MDIIKTIIEKLKIKELFGIIFIAALFVTILPTNLAQTLKIEEFRDTYQTYISICIIIIGAYYLLALIQKIWSYLWRKFHNPKKIALDYLKKTITVDEMRLLVEKYYDSSNKMFRSSAMIEFSDGRKAALESKFILYRASSMSEWYSFAYNLQPYALEFLNKNLKAGNIEIQNNSFKYRLK